MSYLPYLCLFAYIDVQHILCCVFVFLRLVYPMLLVSLDCPFLIAPSVFSNVYLVIPSSSRVFAFILCLVYPMLPVSLDCPFFIAPIVYLHSIFQFVFRYFTTSKECLKRVGRYQRGN